MTNEDDSGPGFRIGDEQGGFGPGGGDDEVTVVIEQRIPRPTISKGVGLLATGFGELRVRLFEFLELFDEHTRLGAIEMSHGEKAELKGFLVDSKRRINGVLSSLNRATRPETKTTNGTNGETP